MLHTEDAIEKYGQAMRYLPLRFKNEALKLSEEEKASAEEFRLRSGGFFSVVIGGVEKPVGNERVCPEDIISVLDVATASSVHTAQNSIRKGYVTVLGGHRIGICGTGVQSDGALSAIRDFSSVSIRIAKSIKTAAEGMERAVLEDGKFKNTLILSPPGHGKTTALRDLVRRLSDMGKRISLVDERCEVAAKHKGTPQFDVGRCTDVLDGTDKASGAILMLRAMSPEIVALDEITDDADADAIFKIISCGVGILATAHGEDKASLFKRPLYQRFCKQGVFERVVTLTRNGRAFCHKVEKL